MVCFGFGISFSQSVLYVASNGLVSNAGTSFVAPTTLQNAIANITSKGTISLAGGTYNFSTPIIIQGENEIVLENLGLKSGIYFIQITSPKRTQILRMVVK